MTDAILEGAERSSRPEARTFRTLDGIRGLCALCVLMWHLPSINLLPSAYLAVDLFFMLSGFVLALRYEDRLRAGGGMRAFMLMRLIRLYPLYLLGSLIGALVALVVLIKAGGGPHAYAAWAAKLGLAALLLPVIGQGALVFPFNVASWSLFYEFVLNAGMGVVSRALRARAMAAVILASGALLFLMAWAKGDLRLTGQMPYFTWAVVRAVFGFCVGVALYRLWRARRLPRLPLPPALILLLVLACLAAPGAGLGGRLLAPAMVTLVFPVIVAAAVQNEPSGPVAQVMAQAGILSFPLYAIHDPLLSGLEMIGARLGLPPVAVALLSAGAALIAAALVSELFDKPVRRWLTGRAQALHDRRRVRLAPGAGASAAP